MANEVFLVSVLVIPTALRWTTNTLGILLMEQRLLLSQSLTLAEYQMSTWYLVQHPTLKVCCTGNIRHPISILASTHSGRCFKVDFLFKSHAVTGQIQEAESTNPLDTEGLGMWLKGEEGGLLPAQVSKTHRYGWAVPTGATHTNPRISVRMWTADRTAQHTVSYQRPRVDAHKALCGLPCASTINQEQTWVLASVSCCRRGRRPEAAERGRHSLRGISAPCPLGSLWQMRRKAVCSHSWGPHCLTWLCRHLSSGSKWIATAHLCKNCRSGNCLFNWGIQSISCNVEQWFFLN